jgi:hypothetical protein
MNQGALTTNFPQTSGPEGPSACSTPVTANFDPATRSCLSGQRDSRAPAGRRYLGERGAAGYRVTVIDDAGEHPLRSRASDQLWRPVGAGSGLVDPLRQRTGHPARRRLVPNFHGRRDHLSATRSLLHCRAGCPRMAPSVSPPMIATGEACNAALASECFATDRRATAPQHRGSGRGYRWRADRKMQLEQL